MRNPDLHKALRSFALEAAALLRDEQSAGAELEFDLDEGTARGGPTLYHYRPLTGKFIGDRWTRLRALPSCGPACDALGAGAAAYLRVNGLRGAEAEPALQAMLERLYEDATDFGFPEDRFERVYAHVERTLFERSLPATVLVAVHGLELDGEHVDLGNGLTLIRGEHSDAPDEAVWGDPADVGPEDARRAPNALLTLTRKVTPDEPLSVVQAGEAFRDILTGMRLWKAGGVALAAVAWRRTGDGHWQPFELESTGVARGAPWILIEGEEEELREFLDAIRGAACAGSVAWALARLEMGLGRRLEAEALSDYLLGLRALLDSGTDGSRSGLGLRVAVLCAEEDERKRTQRRVQLALALEHFVMGDGADDDYFDAVGSDSPRTLVNEVERHLRALLRDLMCGYLQPDLRALADDLLLDQPDPGEIHARALRDGPSTVAARPQPPEGEPHDMGYEIEALEEEHGDVQVRHAGDVNESLPAEDITETLPAVPSQRELDWDDPQSYSAPV
jgi:hypothetical protein